MAEYRPKSTLTVDGQVLMDNTSDDIETTNTGIMQVTSEAEQDMEVMNIATDFSDDQVSRDDFYPSIDHSYVYNVKSLRYTAKESKNEHTLKSTESIVDQIQSTVTNNFKEIDSKSEETLQPFSNCDTVTATSFKTDEQSLTNDISSFNASQHKTLQSLLNAKPQNVSFTDSQTSSLVGGTSDELPKSTSPTPSSAPLGSVQNPIQIIQHGNAYRSSQVLTTDHLKQIAQVLQQQQLTKAIQNGGKSVLYDQATNTRIVYKVIYPSELQNKLNSDAGTSSETISKAKGRSKKNVFVKRINDEDRSKPLLSKEEREEKKKHRPRTRSGRISKPPSYMVKDYKRIHHLDFNEEAYNDSDGGYSDYHVSDEEKEKHLKQGSSSDLAAMKKRSYVCGTCSKSYIGKGGLSRHYRLNPNHGSLPENEDVSTQDENSNSSSVFSMSGTSAPLGTFNISPVSRTETDLSQIQSSFALQDFLSNKRKNKLREVLKLYRDEEISDVVLPRLSQSISLWDFLLSKSKKSQQIDISSMFSQFEILLAQMQEVAKSCLSTSALGSDIGKSIVHITTEDLAKALHVCPGTYFVKDANKSDVTRSYPFDSLHTYNVKNIELDASLLKRSNIITPEDMLTSAKMRKVQSADVEEHLNSLPDQILNDVQEVVELELNLPSVEFDGTSEDPTHVLQAIAGSNNNHDLTSSQTYFVDHCRISPSHRLLQTDGNSTTVTPSSLSSGCLSAVDTSDVLRSHSFISATAAHQLNEIPLFTSSLSNFNVETSIASLQSFNPSNNNKLIDAGVVVSQSLAVANSGGSLLNFNSRSTRPLSNEQRDDDIYCGDIRQTTSVDFNSQSALSLLQGNGVGDIAGVPDCLGEVSIVDTRLCNQSATVDSVMSMRNLRTNQMNFEDVNKCRDIDAASFQIDTPKPVDSIIRQLILPNSQVVGTWSEVQNQPSLSYSEQLIPEQIANNLVLVQNADGSFQVPQDEIVPLVTLQALLNANQADAVIQMKDAEASDELI